MESVVSVYGLIRVSTGQQALDGVSLDQQRAEIVSYCQRNDLPSPEILVEDGVSGFKTEKRPVYQRLVQLCGAGGVSAVVVYDLSRLSRRAKEALSFLDLVQEKKIRFVCIKQQIDSGTIAGKTMLSILAVLNEMMRHEVVERTRSALAYKRSRNEKLGGEVPFGFDLVGNRLVPNTAEMQTLALITHLRGTGMSYRRIGSVLESRRIATKTGLTQWHANTVRKVFLRFVAETEPEDRVTVGDNGAAE
jgi:site-specific DNA recombinase